MSLRDWVVVIVLGIGWGASFVFNAYLLREVGPLSVSFLRTSLGAVTCWAFVFASHVKSRLRERCRLAFNRWCHHTLFAQEPQQRAIKTLGA